MSRWSRPSATTMTSAAIALAVVGVLGGIALHRSRSAPPAQSSVQPSAHAPAAGAPRSNSPRTPALAATTPAPSPTLASPPSVTTHPSGSVPSPSNDQSVAIKPIVEPPRRGLFKISGAPGGRLAPGLSASLDLVLTNPNRFAITVLSLTVRVRSISAPRADAGHPCTRQDFIIAQFSGRPMRLRPAETRALGRLGIAPGRWPRVSMPDRAINQDGCKSASLTLDYRGEGGT